MQKVGIIFADQEDPPLTLSPKEYLKNIQEAYKMGANDILETHIKKQQIKREAQITMEKEKAEVKQRFQNISTHQEIELLRVKTVFPFDYFPDTIVIDTAKITICHKQFFATEFITTIPLKDISDVTLQTAFFMATLIVKYIPQANSSVMNQTVEINVTSLWRKDAIRILNILKGFMVAKAENIDISKLSSEEIITVIEQFGHHEGVL